MKFNLSIFLKNVAFPEQKRILHFYGRDILPEHKIDKKNCTNYQLGIILMENHYFTWTLMTLYKGGIVTFLDGSIIHLKNGVAKNIFTLPDDDFSHSVHLIVTKCDTLIAVVETKNDKIIYCLFEGHPQSVPEGDSPQVYQVYGDDDKTVLGTFYPKLTVFSLGTSGYIYKTFGSVLLLMKNCVLFVYFLKKLPKDLVTYLPSIRPVWKNNMIPSDVSFVRLYMIEKIVNSIMLEDHFFFQQGHCTYLLSQTGMTFFYNFTSGEYDLTGAFMEGTMLRRLGAATKDRKCKLWRLDKKKESATKGLKTTLTSKKTYKIKYLPETVDPEQNMLCETIDKKFKFSLKKDQEVVDFKETPDGLVVLVKCAAMNTMGIVNSLEPIFDLQENVLIAQLDRWYASDLIVWESGLICDSPSSGFYYISLKEQYKLVFDCEKNHDLLRIIKKSDDIMLIQKAPQSDNISKPIESSKYYKIKSIQKDVPVEIEPYSETKSLLKTKNGFYCYDGHQFTRFHEQMNLMLKNLTDEQFAALNIDELVANAENLEFIDFMKRRHVFEIKKIIDRDYRSARIKYALGDACVTFLEGEKYLDTALLAREVNKYHNRLVFTLIGSAGGGPTRTVGSTIIREFVEEYFKYDGFCLVPNDKFKSLSDTKLSALGWIFHDVMHVTQAPVGFVMPLAMLAALVQREPDIIELELYAKMVHEDMYKTMSSLPVSVLEAEGYKTRQDWLSMICRYSPSDIVLYKRFAEGFRSFSEIDPLKDANLISADFFISGSRTIDPSNLISKFMASIEGTNQIALGEKLVDRLICASQSELKIFAFNLSGTYHLQGVESIVFDTLAEVHYKFVVCSYKLYISKTVEESSFDILLDELFQPQQPKMVN
jgi:hypothetical protein